MIIKLCIFILIIALIFYYLLILLEVFNLIKLNHSEDEKLSWFPFYYLFKKTEKKKDIKTRTNVRKRKNVRNSNIKERRNSNIKKV
jgi:hypothetical protein